MCERIELAIDSIKREGFKKKRNKKEKNEEEEEEEETEEVYSLLSLLFLFFSFLFLLRSDKIFISTWRETTRTRGR